MKRTTMSWIIVALLVLIIFLLSLCIYLDIQFTGKTPAKAPATTPVATTPVATTPLVDPSFKPLTPNSPTTPGTAKAPDTTKAPSTTKTPDTTKAPVTTVPPVTTTAPITTKKPIDPDAPTICIDPGHGFEDPGAIRSLNGKEYHEDEINLAISFKLRDALNDLGYNVIMTHDGVNLPDKQYLIPNSKGIRYNVDNRKQWIIDRKSDIDLVVSIHCNTNEDTSIKGARYYILPYGHEDSNNKSVSLAETICDTVAAKFGLTPPTSKYLTDPPLAVLRTKLPSVLVESAFMSNASDLAKLIDPAWQTTLAQGIAQGIDDYCQDNVK